MVLGPPYLALCQDPSTLPVDSLIRRDLVTVSKSGILDIEGDE